MSEPEYGPSPLAKAYTTWWLWRTGPRIDMTWPADAIARALGPDWRPGGPELRCAAAKLRDRRFVTRPAWCYGHLRDLGRTWEPAPDRQPYPFFCMPGSSAFGYMEMHRRPGRCSLVGRALSDVCIAGYATASMDLVYDGPSIAELMRRELGGVRVRKTRAPGRLTDIQPVPWLAATDPRYGGDPANGDPRFLDRSFPPKGDRVGRRLSRQKARKSRGRPW